MYMLLCSFSKYTKAQIFLPSRNENERVQMPYPRPFLGKTIVLTFQKNYFHWKLLKSV